MKKINFNFSGLTRLWQLKLFSVCIAICLWYFVVGEGKIDRTITVTLEPQNLPANLVIANQYKRNIEVVVTGQEWLIQEVLKQKNISRQVDLSNAKPGPKIVLNTVDSISLPRGITVLRVQPDSVTILIDELVQKHFEISPTIEGKPAKGFRLESVTVDPPLITISGPKGILESEPELQTHSINIAGMYQSAKRQVRLQLSESLQRLIGETLVEAQINIAEIMVKKKVGNIPINIKSATSGVKIKPAMVTVEAEIPEAIVRETPELAMLFRAAVSISESGETNNATELPVQVSGVSLPGHSPTIILSVNPDKVRVHK